MARGPELRSIDVEKAGAYWRVVLSRGKESLDGLYV